MVKEFEIAQVGVTTLAVPVGNTLALLIAPDTFQSYLRIKMGTLGSGATVSLFGLGSTAGGTLTSAACASLALIGYGLSTTDVLELKGHPAIYIACAGATSTVTVFKGYANFPASVTSPA